ALWLAADVGLLTSLSEGVSVAILEAMAAGRPMVATNVGGNGEIIADGVTGLLAPRGDAEALATALHRMLADDDLRHSMGVAAAERVNADFTEQRMHAAYLSIYNELLAGSAKERCVA